MNYRLFFVPLAAFALACSGGEGPTQSINPGGGGGAGAVSGDTNVAQLGFVVKSVSVDGATYGYQVFVPANYNSVQKVPVVMYMHGGGENGSDNTSQVRIGLGETVKAQASTFPALVVFPQTPLGEGMWKVGQKIAAAALDQSMKQYGRADSTRIYITGWSAGGGNSWSVAYGKVVNNQPYRFAALAPIAATICGSCLPGAPSTTTPYEGAKLAAQVLKTLPIWQFQGSQDKTVPPSYIADQVAYLKSSGANYQYTEYPNVDHQLTSTVYGQASFWTWLWAQHR
jgi:predicted peptidase